jgi:hypothetical protein
MQVLLAAPLDLVVVAVVVAQPLVVAQEVLVALLVAVVAVGHLV